MYIMHKYNGYTRIAAVFMHPSSVTDLLRIAGGDLFFRDGHEYVQQLRVQLSARAVSISRNISVSTIMTNTLPQNRISAVIRFGLEKNPTYR